MALLFRAAMKWQVLNHFVQHAHKAHISDPLELVFGVVVLVCVIVAAEFVRLSLQLLIGRNLVSNYGGLLVPYMCYFHFVLIPIYLGKLPYDLPEVAFFSIGLWSILSRRWWVFAIVFVLGTVNRETTCFLVPVLLVLEGTRMHQQGKRNEWWKLAVSAVVLTAVWAYLYHFSMHYFSAHPDYVEDFHWRGNLRAILIPWQWPQLPSTFGYLWVPFVLGFRWMKHRGLELCVWLFVLWFAIMFVVGVIIEIRVFSEWIPYVAVCIGLIAHHRFSALLGGRAGNSHEAVEA